MEVLQVTGYSAGVLVKVTSGKKVKKSTEADSCPTGWKIWSPRNKNDWTLVYNKLGQNIKYYPQGKYIIIDVTRGANGCGGCKDYAMKSGINEQSSWRTRDGSAWWLRDTKYKEPSGNYHANCYLSVSGVNPADVQFNDKNCKYSSDDYLCQPMASTFVIDATGGRPCQSPHVTITDEATCKKAQASLSMKWSMEGGAAHAGPGCFHHKNEGSIGFNPPDKKWSGWTTMKAVCLSFGKQSASTPLTSCLQTLADKQLLVAAFNVPTCISRLLTDFTGLC